MASLHQDPKKPRSPRRSARSLALGSPGHHPPSSSSHAKPEPAAAAAAAATPHSGMPPSSNTSSNPTVQSRRSHTKSRKGCKTCKKRHIRCDETVPQCRNCTKHNVRCDYMDGAAVEGAPDLMTTPQIQRELDTWRDTGEYPFPSLGVDQHLSPQRYSPTDLRLIHHISSIATQMIAADAAACAIWTKRVPMFLRIASRHDFVMHSLLGLSASHLEWLTECPATLQLAYQHRGFAFQGLQESIGNFSKDNSDAVLAASILLSWQVTDWRSWASLLQGTSTVIDAMHSWKQESEFAGFMEEKEFFTREPFRSRITNPQRDRHVVNHVYNSLLRLLEYFQGRDEEMKSLNGLISFVRGLHEFIPVHAAEDQFQLLHPLRSWLFFLPIDFLRRGQQDPTAMILLAHFYGVALAVEPLFPAVGAAYFGTMSVGPVEQIQRMLMKRAATSQEAQHALSLMEFPLEMVQHFRDRMNWRRTPAQPAPAAAGPGPEMSPLSPHPVNALNPSHLGGGWNFNAFPEYAMLNTASVPVSGSGGGARGSVTAAGPSPTTPQDVHGSVTASDFIASTMWRQSP